MSLCKESLLEKCMFCLCSHTHVVHLQRTADSCISSLHHEIHLNSWCVFQISSIPPKQHTFPLNNMIAVPLKEMLNAEQPNSSSPHPTHWDYQRLALQELLDEWYVVTRPFWDWVPQQKDRYKHGLYLCEQQPDNKKSSCRQNKNNANGDPFWTFWPYGISPHHLSWCFRRFLFSQLRRPPSNHCPKHT